MKVNPKPRRRKPTVRDQLAELQRPTKPSRWRWLRVDKLLLRSLVSVTKALNQSLPVYQPAPSNKLNSFLLKNRSLLPSYVRGAAHELRQVVWPSLPVALRLTLAVYIFAVIFALLVAGLDWLLNHAFEEIILNKGQNIKDFIEGLF